MKKIGIALLLAVALLCFAGCKGEIRTLDEVPADAELVYTHATGFADSFGVTYGAWEAAGTSGYYVVEVVHQDGKISGLTLHDQTNNKTAASFGSIEHSQVFATDLITQDNASYNLFCGRINKFDGTINVYYVRQ